MRLDKKLKLLGSSLSGKVVFLVQIICSLIIGLLFVFSVSYGYIIGPIAGILYYFGFEYFLIDLGIKKRIWKLNRNALEFFPVFLISLEGNNNVRKSLLDGTKLVHNDLSREFEKVLKEMDVGKSLEEALEGMIKYIPSDLVVNIILSLAEEHKLGSNLKVTIEKELENIQNYCDEVIIARSKLVSWKMVGTCMGFIFLMLMFLVIYKVFL